MQRVQPAATCRTSDDEADSAPGTPFEIRRSRPGRAELAGVPRFRSPILGLLQVDWRWRQGCRASDLGGRQLSVFNGGADVRRLL